ncbi:MAG: hypothetical protein J6T22_09455 [Bacteroidales bacterium]|nr:hypothetical protein [Bacteroidales bacterium]MBO7617420.1 hypothetical protein [Bacteroidales bacterium]
MKGDKLKMVKLNEMQQAAVNSICEYNNFFLVAEGADGKPVVVMNCTKDVFVCGIKDVMRSPKIGNIVTDIVIDYHNEHSAKCKNRS